MRWGNPNFAKHSKSDEESEEFRLIDPATGKPLDSKSQDFATSDGFAGVNADRILEEFKKPPQKPDKGYGDHALPLDWKLPAGGSFLVLDKLAL